MKSTRCPYRLETTREGEPDAVAVIYCGDDAVWRRCGVQATAWAKAELKRLQDAFYLGQRMLQRSQTAG